MFFYNFNKLKKNKLSPKKFIVFRFIFERNSSFISHKWETYLQNHFRF